MFIVGLTGGVGSGKSTVSSYFQQWNVPVIDVDRIARQVVEPGKPAWNKLKAQFDEEYFDSITKELDRKRLGEVVFRNSELRRKLNSIVHPYIRWEIFKAILHFVVTGNQFIVLDIPLLFETGFHRVCQFTIVVSCSQDKQLERILARDDVTQEHARNMVNSQIPLIEKEKLATFVIDNNGELINTRRQAEQIYKKLRKSHMHWVYRIGFGILTIGGMIVLISLKRILF